jgi:hypothetical protein
MGSDGGGTVTETPNLESRTSRSGRWKLMAGLALGVLFLGAIGLGVRTFVDVRNDQRAVSRGGCPTPDQLAAPSNNVSSPSSTQLAVASPNGAKSAPSATLKVGQPTSVSFGRSTSTKDLVLLFSLDATFPRDVKQLGVRIDTFRRGDDARLNAEDITATAAPDGRVLKLHVCFGRMGNKLGSPGTYNGSVTIADPMLASDVTIPVTVTMQYIHGAALLWLLFFVVLPASWLLWITKRERTSDYDSALSWDWLEWLLSVTGVIAIVTGAVAAISVYVATYLKDPTWGSGAFQATALYGAMFSAFIATAGITHAGAERFQAGYKSKETAPTGKVADIVPPVNDAVLPSNGAAGPVEEGKDDSDPKVTVSTAAHAEEGI